MTAELRPRSRKVYCSIAAQADNLGDIEIRRALLHRLAEAGFELVVFTGRMPHSYVTAFNLPDTAIRTANPIEFQARFTMDALSGRASLLFAPGPYRAAGGSKALAKAVVNNMNVRLAQARGGSVVAAGRAYRVESATAARIERSSIRRFDLLAIRDDVSSVEVGMPLRQEPDLALLGKFERPMGARGRYVAVSLRSDRPASPSMLGAVRDAASRQGLEMIFVTQVRRDATGHRRLADELGVPIIDWTDEEHAVQESRVLDVYRHSAAILSDRLHSILLAVRMGAMPITFAGEAYTKIPSTVSRDLPLRLIHVNDAGEPVGDIEIDALVRRNEQDLDALESALLRARSRLDRLVAEVEGCLDG
jgi:hypothetical protein